MKLQTSLDTFNLYAFLKQAIQDGTGIMTPPVFAVERLEDCWSDDETQYFPEVLTECLLQDGQYVYVNFSDCGLERDIRCIDGNEYYLIHQDDYEDELAEQEEDWSKFPDDVKPVQGFDLNETRSVGYVLQYENSTLTIQSSIFHAMGKRPVGPCGAGYTQDIEMLEDAELFEEPMKEYVRQFVQ
ncbi:hypothetical protein [Ectobacillus ponti]|uniref:Uncharacterized protein n=1 Tax=Ectobacillus ponti TaxID=2961894 RepID=A0AA41XF11_9BACI|nr:hypothetical protein [Ectobacillus ponti]MCP8970906.1 hypothetical protein [Ectobacillus ponti]